MDTTVGEYYKLVGKPLELFSSLQKMCLGHDDDEESVALILVELNKTYQVDICELAAKALQQEFNVFDMECLLEKLLHLLNLNTKSLFELLRIISSKMQKDMLSYMQYQPIALIAQNQPDFAVAFLDSLINSEEDFIQGYIVEIVQNLPSLTISNKHAKFASYVMSDLRPVKFSGIAGLGLLNYNLSADAKLIERTLQLFDLSIVQQEDRINQCIVNNLFKLYRNGLDVKAKLLELSEKDDQYVLFAIAQYLHYVKTNTNDGEFIKKLFLSLSKTSFDCVATIKHVDLFIYAVLGDLSWHDLLIEFFIKWGQESNFNISKHETYSLLDCTISKFHNHQGFFQTLITKLFNDDSEKCHELASSLMSAYSVQLHAFQKRCNISFDKSMIEKLAIDDIVFISRKILAYTHDANILCSLFYSLHEVFYENNSLSTIITNVFINIIGYAYPKTTTEFLKEKMTVLTDSHIDLKHKDSIESIMKRIEENAKKYKQFKELSPKFLYIRMLLENERKRKRIIFEEADKHSIAALLTHKVEFKYGKKFSSCFNGTYTEPTGFARFSVSYEISKAELFAPVYAAVERFNFSLAKRGAK